MRNAMIALLLCACSQTALVKRPSAMRVAVEAAISITEYQWFYRELSAGNYDNAKTIADQKNIDHQKVVEDVLAVMWQEVKSNGFIEESKNISQTFKINRATELVFAKNAFDSAVARNFCEIASDVAFYFNLGTAYADKAIICLQAQHNPATDSFYFASVVAQMACQTERPGTIKLRDELISSWVEIYKNRTENSDYVWMVEIAGLCPLTVDQYKGLFESGMISGQLSLSLHILKMPGYKAFGLDLQPLYRRLYEDLLAKSAGVGLLRLLYDWPLVESSSEVMPLSKDMKLDLAQEMLNDADFRKTPADGERLITENLNRLKCGLAATIALEQKLPDKVVEKVFLSSKCFGGNLAEVNLNSLPSEKVKWFFDLSLQAREYLLAYNLVKKFKLEDSYFNRIVDEAIAARDFDWLIDLDPPEGSDKKLYQERILDRVMNLNEEWFIVLYSFSPHSESGYETNVNEYWDTWIRRAGEHALNRNAFALAADIFGKREYPGPREDGIQSAFEAAVKAGSKEAEQIAARWPNLDRSAWLADVKKKEAELEEKRQKKRAEKRRKIRACKIGDDWCIQQVK